MSSTLCQPQKPCLEPHLLQPQTLTHQSAPSKQDLCFPIPQKPNETQNNYPISKPCESNSNDQKPIGGWNLIQSLTGISSNTFRQPIDEPELVYVHPLLKRSTSWLSPRSLEMCTESLGSETGTDIDSSFDPFSYLEAERQHSPEPKTKKTCKKMKQSKIFPPPLTSNSGNDGIKVQSHREGGRLLIKAFSFSFRATYFRAERESGRLKLYLIRDCKEYEEEGVAEDDGVEAGNINGCIWGENRKDDAHKIGSGEWSSSRCSGDRSGGKRLPSLPFCVAIS